MDQERSWSARSTGRWVVPGYGSWAAEMVVAMTWLLLILFALGSPFSLAGQVSPEPVLETPTVHATDSALPVKQFPKDLVHNFAALWSGDNVRPLIVGAAVTGSVISADDRVAGFFENPSRWQGFDGLGRELGKSQLLGPAIGVSYLVSRVTDNTDYQRFTHSLAQGFLITNTLTGGLKAIAGRQRPDASSNLSFPSGHTSNSFLWATVVSRHYGWKAGIPAFAAASYVGASRLASRKHFLTDVVAGATLGYIVGRTVTRNSRDNRDRRFRLGVAVPPGGGAAISLGIRAW